MRKMFSEKHRLSWRFFFLIQIFFLEKCSKFLKFVLFYVKFVLFLDNMKHHKQKYRVLFFAINLKNIQNYEMNPKISEVLRKRESWTVNHWSTSKFVYRFDGRRWYPHPHSKRDIFIFWSKKLRNVMKLMKNKFSDSYF